jgi:hypothetical protein
MTEKPPKTRPPDNFAAFDPLSRGRRRVRWALNPLPNSSAEAAGLSSLAAEITRGIGRTREGGE